MFFLFLNVSASFCGAWTRNIRKHLRWNSGSVYDFYFFVITLQGVSQFLHIPKNISQRPLKTIAKRSGDVYIPRGVSVPALDKDCLWEFQPNDFGNVF